MHCYEALTSTTRSIIAMVRECPRARNRGKDPGGGGSRKRRAALEISVTWLSAASLLRPPCPVPVAASTSTANMGRRAKNKQGDPRPIDQAYDKPSQKKLGKRKADEVDSGAKRPAKKVKENAVKPLKAPVAANGKTKSALKVAKPRADQPKPKKQKQARFEDEDEDEDEGAGSSEGWEDVDDDGDLKAQAKCVFLSSSPRPFSCDYDDIQGRCSMRVTRASLSETWMTSTSMP